MPRVRPFMFMLLVFYGAAACGTEPDVMRRPQPSPTTPAPILPGPQAGNGADPSNTVPTDLAAMIGRTDSALVGIAVDPNTNQRYVLDAFSGLYLLGDNSATLIADLGALVDPNAPPLASAFTDLTACGEGRLLLTARNDGYLFDLATHTLRSHFCYLPDTAPNNSSQLTNAVGCDATRIFAQPQTFDSQGNISSSQVGVWELESGLDSQWLALPDTGYLADGLVVWDDSTLLLALGDRLDAFDLQSGTLTTMGSLSAFGIQQVGGMALDRSKGALLLTDLGTRQLITVPMGSLSVP